MLLRRRDPARRHYPALALLAGLIAAAGALPLLTPTVAPAATAQTAAAVGEVTGFGSNPGNLQMFRYVPAGLPAGRPVVVALHGCAQNGPAYGRDAGWLTLADRHGFAVLLPQQRSANNLSACFNWFSSGDTTRGTGETASIMSMINRTRSDLGSGPVYVSGLSAGGAMSAALLATHPEAFAGGGIVAGIPFRCATSQFAAFGCLNPGVDRTPRQWGDAVRAAAPAPAARPRVAVWHGDADTTVRPRNATESVEQWTDVLGTGQVPDTTTTIGSATRTTYGTSAAGPLVERWIVRGMGHGQPVDPGFGPQQCGSAAPYLLDVDRCAAAELLRFWGVTGSGAGR